MRFAAVAPASRALSIERSSNNANEDNAKEAFKRRSCPTLVHQGHLAKATHCENSLLIYLLGPASSSSSWKAQDRSHVDDAFEFNFGDCLTHQKLSKGFRDAVA